MEPEYSLHNVHMMLPGFAIENFCKGVFGRALKSRRTRIRKAGNLPKSLKGTHGILGFVERTGMKLAPTAKKICLRELVR
jgi:hypothetical protein